MPRHRVVGNIGMSFLTKAASGYWGLFDPQNGYTAIHRSALERLQLDRLAKRYEFENDLLIKLNVLRVPARDVPIPAVYGDRGLRAARSAGSHPGCWSCCGAASGTGCGGSTSSSPSRPSP